MKAMETAHGAPPALRYRPLLELGRGGMSRVYLAQSLCSEVQKLVVLKVLNPEFAVDPEMRTAFRREGEISARLNHPNVVQVFEVVEHAGTPMIVMQYLDGIPLSEILRRTSGELPLSLHLQVLTQLLSGLHYFHELKDADDTPLGCVHRDVSPQNVLVLYEGGIKVLDFGIAKIHALTESHTRVGVIKGKIRYMPAEQLLGTTGIDRRADIYSVGVMLWEAVARRRMWRGVEESAIMRSVVRGDTPSIREAAPGVSDELAAVIERALSLDREVRYPTAKEMQLDLEQAMPTAQGYAYTRRMAELMRKRFGEDRRIRQLSIKVALQAPKVSLEPAISGSRADPRASTFGSRTDPRASTDARAPDPQTHARSRVLGASADRDIISLARASAGFDEPDANEHTAKHWRASLLEGGWPWAVSAAALVLGALGTLALSQHADPQVHAAPARPLAPKAVSIQVQSEPQGAEVLLDQQRLGWTPFRGSFAASSHDALIEVRRPGFLPEKQFVRLDADLTLALNLQPESRAAANAPVVQPAPDETVRAQATQARTEPTQGKHERGTHTRRVRAADGLKEETRDARRANLHAEAETLAAAPPTAGETPTAHRPTAVDKPGIEAHPPSDALAGDPRVASDDALGTGTQATADVPAAAPVAAHPSAPEALSDQPSAATEPPTRTHCHPPYRLAADGVKIFRPECF